MQTANRYPTTGNMNTCYRQSQEYKQKIRERDNHTCQLCDEYGHEVDHIIPFVVSHDSSHDNLRVLCVKCNRAIRRERYDASLPLDQWYAYIEAQLLCNTGAKGQDDSVSNPNRGSWKP